MIKKIVLCLSILFAVFVSLFALDVFGEETWLLALIMHLIPTFMIVVLTIISWKKELLGGILWIISGLLIILTTKIGLIITVPIIIIGGLNVVVWKLGLK